MPSPGELDTSDLRCDKPLQRERSNRLAAAPDRADYCARAEVTGM